MPRTCHIRGRKGGIVMRRLAMIMALGALLGIFSGAGVAAPAFAGAGPPGGGVQHEFTNGPFATAYWVSQTARTATQTSVTAVRHPGGGKELTVFQEVDTLDANGFVLSTTFTTVDVASGFTFTIDATHLTGAAVHGTGLPAQTCGDTCHPTTLSVSANWTGQGALTRGAVNSTDNEARGNFFYLQIEHLSGASRNATATGTIGAFSYSAADAAVPAMLGNMHTGYIFLCMAAGCEN
jgi:hypothetical protein